MEVGHRIPIRRLFVAARHLGNHRILSRLHALRLTLFRESRRALVSNARVRKAGLASKPNAVFQCAKRSGFRLILVGLANLLEPLLAPVAIGVERHQVGVRRFERALCVKDAEFLGQVYGANLTRPDGIIQLGVPTLLKPDRRIRWGGHSLTLIKRLFSSVPAPA